MHFYSKMYGKLVSRDSFQCQDYVALNIRSKNNMAVSAIQGNVTCTRRLYNPALQQPATCLICTICAEVLSFYQRDKVPKLII